MPTDGPERAPDASENDGIAVLGPEATRERLPFARLIPALRQAFAADPPMPHRHHLSVPGTDTTMLLMPSWTPGGKIGVKLVNVVPANAALRLPSVQSVYLLSDFTTGRWLALLDGNEITARRTAAVAALAASFLARPDSHTMLIVGSGRIARLLPEAFRIVRPELRRFMVWNVNGGSADTLAASLAEQGLDAAPVTDLAAAVRQADVISCATLSRAPLVRGCWLRPGTHLDLIGSFQPSMHEADEEAVRRSRVFVDTWDALTEAGELVGALASGAIARDQIGGRLADLCANLVPGRRDAEDITTFKAVGTSLADLAAAELVYDGSRAVTRYE